ncbi:hypothetical protein [Methylacidimicrobium sp. B4]|uniref:hypothetical protein n=1 Tax=Methylacidimicrobium sp. B4 TaxID=2796139 RepID=UPI001A8EC8C5|nr:hypothetical protein [Methylacidimicrobium sp. B4]QSR85272.1 hypothetical protein MacB4_03175 [Methylacidimicrobium sp. B4]
MRRMFAFEQRRLDVRKKDFQEFSAKLPAQTVAKFYQLENRLNLLVDVNLASSRPTLLEKPVNQQGGRLPSVTVSCASDGMGDEAAVLPPIRDQDRVARSRRCSLRGVARADR